MLITHNHKQRGFSLLEFILALTIGAILVVAIVNVFINGISSSTLNLQKGKLDNELQTVMNVIVSDIQRAGYWANASTSKTDPFMAASVDLLVDGSQTATNGTCILLVYDENNDGTLPAATDNVNVNDERYGFRKQGDTIQSRSQGEPFACNASANTWDDMIDSSAIKITQFQVTKNTVSKDIDGSGSSTDTINYRTITISLSGQLTNDSSITQTMTRSIKVYNPKYVG